MGTCGHNTTTRRQCGMCMSNAPCRDADTLCLWQRHSTAAPQEEARHRRPRVPLPRLLPLHARMHLPLPPSTLSVLPKRAAPSTDSVLNIHTGLRCDMLET